MTQEAGDVARVFGECLSDARDEGVEMRFKVQDATASHVMVWERLTPEYTVNPKTWITLGAMAA